jgi:REP element-mobilizing transposase RayT
MAGTFTNLLYHVVFSTKHREPLITSPIRRDLYAYMGGIVRGEGGSLLEIGGMPDHVHLVVRFRAEPSVATMVKTVKAKSSGWLNQHPKRPGRFYWQTGYGAFTVSVSQLAVVMKYVQTQETHHRRKSFREEFCALLDRHGIEYDERYLWD